MNIEIKKLDLPVLYSVNRDRLFVEVDRESIEIKSYEFLNVEFMYDLSGNYSIEPDEVQKILSEVQYTKIYQDIWETEMNDRSKGSCDYCSNCLLRIYNEGIDYEVIVDADEEFGKEFLYICKFCLC